MPTAGVWFIASNLIFTTLPDLLGPQFAAERIHQPTTEYIPQHLQAINLIKDLREIRICGLTIDMNLSYT